MKDRLIEWAYGAAWRVVRTMPEGLAARLFRAGADRAARRGGRSVERLRRNLRQVVGPDVPEHELDVLVRDGMRSYARYWLEAFRLPSMGRERILERFHLDRWEVFDEHRAQGTGVIVALPHAGNWDLAGAWVCVKGYPLASVVERLKPEAVYEKFLDFRRSLGMEVVPHTGGDRPPLDVLADRVKEGYVVPLLADRDLSARGVPIEILGGRSRMPAGPALLAIRTGAPLYTATLWNEPDRARAALVGPIPVPTEGTSSERVAVLCQRIADNFAANFIAHPTDWHMLQRYFLDDKPGAAGIDAPGGPATAAEGAR